eukprot:Lankesteria_metandrocarpae@DN583_c0_g1_i1.p1
MSTKYDYLAKILLIGDSGVGKSCLLVRLSEDAFSTNHITTIGIDFKVKFIDVDGLRIKLQIWDTAGQERFRTITQAYYRSAMGVLIVYDESSLESFQNARSWLEQINLHAAPEIQKMILGNKCDLTGAIPEGAQEQLSTEYGISWQKTSAKTGEGVEEAFTKLARQIVKALKSQTAAEGSAGAGAAIKTRNQTLVTFDSQNQIGSEKKSACC